jgi:carbonic anhydrase
MKMPCKTHQCKTRKIRKTLAKKRSMRNKKWWGGAQVSDLFVDYKSPQPHRDQRQLDKANALVLTCMDFRFIDDEDRFLDQIGLNNSYDQFVLAGASLAYSGPTKSYYKHYEPTETESIVVKRASAFKTNNDEHPWVKALDEHIKLAIALHKIQEVIVIDHMDCGAYKALYKELDKNDLEPNEEYVRHVENIKLFIKKIKKTHTLPASGYLLDINEEILYASTNRSSLPISYPNVPSDSKQPTIAEITEYKPTNLKALLEKHIQALATH